MTLIPSLVKLSSNSSSKKMTRLDNIKAANEKLENMLVMFQDDVGIVAELENFKKLFINLVKSFETVKKTRSNSNTGLGKKRFVTLECSDFIKLAADPQQPADDLASRSFMTSLISTYVKMNMLQSGDEPLYFRIDKELEKLFNIKKYIGKNLDKLAKVAELRCIDQRLSQRVDMTKEEAIESYKKRYVEYMNHSQSDDDSDESQVDDILNIISIKENDLISWRESLKILFIVFNDGSH
jgi:hypothetical protein